MRGSGSSGAGLGEEGWDEGSGGGGGLREGGSGSSGAGLGRRGDIWR